MFQSNVLAKNTLNSIKTEKYGYFCFLYNYRHAVKSLDIYLFYQEDDRTRIVNTNHQNHHFKIIELIWLRIRWKWKFRDDRQDLHASWDRLAYVNQIINFSKIELKLYQIKVLLYQICFKVVFLYTK